MLLRSTTASINCVVPGPVISSTAVAFDAPIGLPRRFRPLLPPRDSGISSLLFCVSFAIETKVPFQDYLFGPSVRRTEPTMPSADFWRIIGKPLDLPSSWQSVRPPRVMRTPFTLMTVAYTSTRSVSVSGFDDICRLTPRVRLMRFLFVSPALCLRLPSDSTSRWTPLPSG